MDGVDAVLVDVRGESLTTRAAYGYPYPAELRRRLLSVVGEPESTSVHEIATLNVEIGCCFATAVDALLAGADVPAAQLVAIGSHGQTLRHSPDTSPAYSWQIGDPATIAARTGVTTVADFRSTDVALGGQGAPLLPALHAALFRRPGVDRAVVNVGGIANVTLLPADLAKPVTGYDTGPGNCLMDEWCTRHRGQPYDEGGAWAATGTAHGPLLASLMDDPYLSRPPPKSTGRETYNLRFLEAHLDRASAATLPPADVQATLLQFTACSIARAIEKAAVNGPEWLGVCGGGVHNTALLRALRHLLPHVAIESTAASGVDPDMVEATAFAWFAARRLADRPLDLTTASPPRRLVLGAVYPANAQAPPSGASGARY